MKYRINSHSHYMFNHTTVRRTYQLNKVTARKCTFSSLWIHCPRCCLIQRILTWWFLEASGSTESMSFLFQNCRQTGEAAGRASLAWGCSSLIHRLWPLPSSPQMSLFCPEIPSKSLRKSTHSPTAIQAVLLPSSSRQHSFEQKSSLLFH
jgi:hypothetical protein